MTDFAHITPTAYLDLFATGRPFHLTLAHLVEQDDEYAKWYSRRDLSRSLMPFLNIMDNSAFELYKNQMPMFTPDELLPLAKKVHATHIVLPDHPAHPSMVTIDDARRYTDSRIDKMMNDPKFCLNPQAKKQLND